MANYGGVPPEEIAEYEGERHLSGRDMYYRMEYGITLDDYNRMWNAQNGKCAICGTHQFELKKKLAVDHDHKTGKVRGLLCSMCNIGLGHFKDDANLLVEAMMYLHKAKKDK